MLKSSYKYRTDLIITIFKSGGREEIVIKISERWVVTIWGKNVLDK
jgi:hypothetical protein